MRGWILYKDSANRLKPETYEINRFIKVAEESNIDITVIQPEQVELIVAGEDRKSILLDEEPVSLPDFVLPRTGSGTTCFGLAVLGHLERLGVKAFNAFHSIEIAKDKLYTHQIIAENNLPVPTTMLARFPVDIDMVEKYIGFPLLSRSCPVLKDLACTCLNLNQDFKI